MVAQIIPQLLQLTFGAVYTPCINVPKCTCGPTATVLVFNGFAGLEKVIFMDSACVWIVLVLLFNEMDLSCDILVRLCKSSHKIIFTIYKFTLHIPFVVV